MFVSSFTSLSVTAYQRGLAPHLVETVVIGAARAFLTPHVTQFCRSLGPNEVDAVHLPPWRVQLSRWLSSNGPHLIVQNLVMVLTYPLILTTTVACIPSVRPFSRHFHTIPLQFSLF